MKTLNDIIHIVWALPCCGFDSCLKCPMGNYCGVDTKLLALDYLYRGEYYG